MRWRRRRPASPPPPRPRARRDLADADADASSTPDVPAVPTEVRVTRDDPEDAGPSDDELFASAPEQASPAPPTEPSTPTPPPAPIGEPAEPSTPTPPAAPSGEPTEPSTPTPPAAPSGEPSEPSTPTPPPASTDEELENSLRDVLAASAWQARSAASEQTPTPAGDDPANAGSDLEDRGEPSDVMEVEDAETPSGPGGPEAGAPDAGQGTASAPEGPPSRAGVTPPEPAAGAEALPEPTYEADGGGTTGAPLPRRPRGASRGSEPGDTTLDEDEVAAAGRAAVRRALDEDLGVGGDVTSLTTVPPDAVGRATIVARADGVVAGVDLVALVYDHLDPRVSVEAEVADGEHVRRGQALLRLAGPLRSVLTGERTALNLLTHLSGVATRTAEYVSAVEGTGCVVRDTRKTTPGLRLLEKSAVRAGGGVNHRVGLSDALLVKDNHVAAAGGVGPATRAALAGAEGRHVQVEVDTLAELDEALDAGARDVLLDNFDVQETRRAVDHVRQREATDGRVLLETSGGVTLETVRDYAEAGVDRIAIGGLTHSAPQLDIALDVADDRRAPDVRLAPGPVAGGTGDERIFPSDGD